MFWHLAHPPPLPPSRQVCEYALLSPASAPAFFRAAAAVHTPVVLMGEAPSQQAVLQGVRWGAADFLEKPLSMLKLRTIWQHKIRKVRAGAGGWGPQRPQHGLRYGAERLGHPPSHHCLGMHSCRARWCASRLHSLPVQMMERGNGGVLPRRPSCPQLPSHSAGSLGEAGKQAVMSRSASLAGLSCPTTPLLRTPAAPQTSSSLVSADSMPAAAGDSSDATSGLPQLAASGPAFSAATGPAAPLACLRLGAPGEALPAAVVHWPALPAGTTWGTPMGCGVPPPPLPGAPGGVDVAAGSAPAPPAFPQPSIKWCPPGSLPMPSTTYDLLLPEDFSLARTATEACHNACAGGGGRGPLGLRLTITPDLLTNLNATLHGQPSPGRPPLMPTTAPVPAPPAF